MISRQDRLIKSPGVTLKGVTLKGAVPVRFDAAGESSLSLYEGSAWNDTNDTDDTNDTKDTSDTSDTKSDHKRNSWKGENHKPDTEQSYSHSPKLYSHLVKVPPLRFATYILKSN